MEPMEPIYSHILEAVTSRDSPGSFTIDGEVEKRDHLTNAVLHCYILISVGLIHDSPGNLESQGGKIILRGAGI
jgi:hypothetical protein